MEESFNARLDESIKQIQGFEKLDEIKYFSALEKATKDLITLKAQLDKANPEDIQALTNKWDIALFSLGITFARFTKINPHKVSSWIFTELGTAIDKVPTMSHREAITTYTALNKVAQGIIGGLGDNTDYKATIKSINGQLNNLKTKIERVMEVPNTRSLIEQ